MAQAIALVAEVRALWQSWLDNVETLFPQLRDHTLRASWKTQLRTPLQTIFTGAAFKPILDEADIHQRVLKGRVWVALHMHAGDGNVHTNIPVNSDDYEMLQTAHEAVARIMVLARSLDGVISASTASASPSWSFDRRRVAAFADYKRKVDPEGRFNKGQAAAKSGLPALAGQAPEAKTLQTLR